MVEKVRGGSGAGGASSTRAPERTGGAEFSRALESVNAPAGVETSAPLAPTGGVMSLSAVLAAQQPEDERPRRRQRALTRGQALLEELEALRLAVLSGTYPADRLAALLTITQTRLEETEDPALNRLLTEIDLRARVELAKLGKI